MLRWIQLAIPLTNRWYPVFQRYLGQIADRVEAFGGDPSRVIPSPVHTGPAGMNLPDRDHDHHDIPCLDHGAHFTGKITGLIYDRFGDFEGLLDTKDGERAFKSRNTKFKTLRNSPGPSGSWYSARRASQLLLSEIPRSCAGHPGHFSIELRAASGQGRRENENSTIRQVARAVCDRLTHGERGQAPGGPRVGEPSGVPTPGASPRSPSLCANRRLTALIKVEELAVQSRQSGRTLLVK